ncbi:hypothetical protein [Lactobacillus helveticus]|uniref:hypothetical protein n=4 Tax=Lactobacillus helveticus TaxID=1587 RepID=UPI001561B33C|nr:hypothetical protein [Lactobacillus helveticus]NRO01603.1 hypothetical protein [Lactobacillus helveticus]NRO92893.1 hypothetical protein [Lactobacillus helveticus]
MVNNLVHLGNTIWQWLVQNIFSISALAISLLTLHRNRTTLEVKFSPRIDRTMDLSTEITDKNGNYIHAYRNVFLVSVEIINSSPNDIAYYDLYAFDPKTNNFLEFVNPKAFSFSHPGVGVIHYINKVTFNILNVPLEQYGVFKANSYTKFDLPIIVTDPDEIKNIDTLAVGFKAIKRTLFKNTNKQSYYMAYNVKNLLQDSRFKKGYNNQIKIFIYISEILNSAKLEDDFLYDELSKLDIILGELKNSEISDQALSDIVNMYKYLIENKTMLSVEVKSLLRDITKRSTLGFATENNQKRKDLMLEIKKDFSKILDGTITSTKF